MGEMSYAEIATKIIKTWPAYRPSPASNDTLYPVKEKPLTLIRKKG
jgi:hypothetical protein